MAQLFQNDSRWKNDKIGLQNSLTISQVGCLLTSMAIVVNHYGGSVTPASLNNMMKSVSGFNGAWIKTAQVPDQFPQLGMKRQKWVQCDHSPAPMELIDQALALGSLIVARVDWSADPGIQGHWVVLYKKEGNDYLIWDPWQLDKAPNKLIERYGFNSKDPADIILEAIWHGKGDFPPATTQTTAPSSTTARKDVVSAKQGENQGNALWVKPTINQLSLRRQPVSGYIDKLLSTNDSLMVIEGGDASAKIGQRNAWLQVQTADGNEGYVAAWYVQKVEASATTPATQPTPTTAVATTIIKTSADQVSFRSQPYVANNTFIRTLPRGTVLTALDENAAVKVGQQNQWLHVRTNDNQEGYIAAWLASKN